LGGLAQIEMESLVKTKAIFSWYTTATPDHSGEARCVPKKKSFWQTSLEWKAGLASVKKYILIIVVRLKILI